MKVRSYWVQQDSFVKTIKAGTPVIAINLLTGEGRLIGNIERTEENRALLVLNTPVEWRALEDQGVGFSQFEDTED